MCAMLRKAAAGLAGLGLIGGAGAVVYNHNGDAAVKIRQGSGRVQSVRISAGGRTFSCPFGTRDKLKPHDIMLGRIKPALRGVRRKEHVFLLRYPSRRAPDAVVRRFNVLKRHEARLVTAYNAQARAHNAILERACVGG
jgi:hypothetical protein